jgi:hypothetical protein
VQSSPSGSTSPPSAESPPNEYIPPIVLSSHSQEKRDVSKLNSPRWSCIDSVRQPPRQQHSLTYCGTQPSPLHCKPRAVHQIMFLN